MKASPKYFYFLLLLLISVAAQAQQNLERVKVTKEISMKVPTDFITMPQVEVTNKYIAARTPLAMFTSTDRQIDLGVNSNSSTWAATDLDILSDFYRANILNLFTEVQFIQEEKREIGGREFIVYEFLSKVKDEESTIGEKPTISKYTYMIYTLYNNRVLIFNFTSPSRVRNQWKAAAHEMMESVRIK